MIREHLFSKRIPTDPMFRWRGGEMSRLEGLSDGVFAVTLTLLVVSLEVPDTFQELWLTIRDLPVFLVSFVMLLMAWRYHYLFFRRYGLEDFLTSVLNGAFLFLIMFYAYPLKFVATFLWKMILGDDLGPMFAFPEGTAAAFPADAARAGMMYFYGIGAIGVFGLLALMLLRAYRLRDQLELDELERYLTRGSIRAHLISVGVAVLSITVLAVTGSPPLAGLTYFLMGPLHAAHGFWHGSRAERMFKELESAR